MLTQEYNRWRTRNRRPGAVTHRMAGGGPGHVDFPHVQLRQAPPGERRACGQAAPLPRLQASRRPCPVSNRRSRRRKGGRWLLGLLALLLLLAGGAALLWVREIVPRTHTAPVPADAPERFACQARRGLTLPGCRTGRDPAGTRHTGPAQGHGEARGLCWPDPAGPRDLPPGVTAAPATVAAAQSEGEIELTAAPTAAPLRSKRCAWSRPATASTSNRRPSPCASASRPSWSALSLPTDNTARRKPADPGSDSPRPRRVQRPCRDRVDGPAEDPQSCPQRTGQGRRCGFCPAI